MGKFIIKESQYKRIFETGSNSAAMDLDRYVQPVYHDTSTGNESIEDSIKQTISRLNELNSALKTGKKIPKEKKTEFYRILDELNELFFSSTEM